MKNSKSFFASFVALFVAFGMTSCTDKDEPDPTPDDPTLIKDYHFDLWGPLIVMAGWVVTFKTLVRSINSLEADQPEITFQGTGIEVNSILSL